MNLPSYITGTVQSKGYRLLRGHVYDVLDEFDLTLTYWAMLGIIFQARDGVRQVEIARALHVKAPLITAMAHKLEERGIIHSVQNQFDARAKLLAVTPEGKKFIKIVETALHKNLSHLLEGLTESDLETYHKVLLTIITNSEAMKEKRVE